MAAPAGSGLGGGAVGHAERLFQAAALEQKLTQLHQRGEVARIDGEPLPQALLKRREVLAHLFLCAPKLVTPGRLELPAYGLGNRRSILLSYGVTAKPLPHLPAIF